MKKIQRWRIDLLMCEVEGSAEGSGITPHLPQLLLHLPTSPPTPLHTPLHTTPTFTASNKAPLLIALSGKSRQ